MVGGFLADDAVPVGFHSGDAALVESARRRYPWIVGVPIEKDEAANTGPGREPLWAGQRERLRAGAERAARSTATMRPVEPPRPYRFEVVHRNEKVAARRAALWGLDREGPRIAWERPTFPEAFEVFLRLTFFTPRTYPWQRTILALLGAMNRFRYVP